MKRNTWLWLAIGLTVLAVTGGAVVAVLNSNWLKNRNAAKYLPLLNAAETKYGIPRNLLARQAYQESHFRDDIVNGSKVSSAGALGIMQIVPKFHPNAKPLDVAAAIDYAAALMKSWHDHYGSWALALAAYNAGPGNVNKYKSIPPFAETQNYVHDILADLINPNDQNSQLVYA
jgi:soluble lytic murein transglycosylase-like protein